MLTVGLSLLHHEDALPKDSAAFTQLPKMQVCQSLCWVFLNFADLYENILMSLKYRTI